MNKLKEFTQRYIFFSVKSTIIALYLPLIILFVIITASISFILASSQIEDNTYKNLEDTIFQTKNHIEFVLMDIFRQHVELANDPKIISLLVSDKEEITPADYINIDEEIDTIYLRNSEIIESILVDMNDGEFSFFRSPHEVRNTSFSYDSYFRDYQGSKEGYYWRNIHPDEVFEQGSEVLTLFKLFGTKESESKGIILFNLKSVFLKQILNQQLMDQEGYITLISPEGNIHSKQINEKYQIDQDQWLELYELADKSGEYKLKSNQGEDLIISYDTIAINNWKIAAVIPQTELNSKVDSIKYITLVLILTLIVLAIFFTNIIGKFISKPIENLGNKMQFWDDQTPIKLVKPSGPKEVVNIQHSFSELTSRINRLMSDIKIEQEDKRELELAIIHAQINPHFLYNTLYSIKELCDLGLNKDASSMISALSGFYRIGLSEGKEIITIEEEVEHIKYYLYMEELRYGDQFSYEINVDPAINSYEIVKVSLQPIIENAIYHGVKQSRGMGNIRIKGFEAEGNICFEVIDNGPGIKSEQLLQIKKEINYPRKKQKKYIGVGIKSVHERIKLYFGKSYGLTITNGNDGGVCVTITIPKKIGE